MVSRKARGVITSQLLSFVTGFGVAILLVVSFAGLPRVPADNDEKPLDQPSTAEIDRTSVKVQFPTIKEQLETLLREGYASGQLSTDWLSKMLFFRDDVYENLSVGNPGVRDGWISAKAEAIGKQKKGQLLIDVSAGNKPYEAVFRASGFEYHSSEFGGNSLLRDGFRGESVEEAKSETDLKGKHTFVYSDIRNTGIPGDAYDVAVLTEVLEHLPEPIVAMHELARIVTAGGHILVTAPFTSGSHQLPFHFSAGYSREWYVYAANQTGLEIVEMTTQGNFFNLMAQEMNRATHCGSNPRELKPEFAPILETMRHGFHYLYLLKGQQNDASVGCVEQFTIGWMVHLRKPFSSRSMLVSHQET